MSFLDPINDPFMDSPEPARTFPCACGDRNCVGFDDDKDNRRIGKDWYAADCSVLPSVLASLGEQIEQARAEFDDIFNQVRR